MVMQLYKGSCHCGAIRFSFEAEPFAHGVRCNCSFCSRRGTMVSLVPGAQFHIEAKEGALGLYQGQEAGEALFLPDLRHPPFQRDDEKAGAIYREPRLRRRRGYLCAGNDGVRREAFALGIGRGLQVRALGMTRQTGGCKR
jgi:hypothetical protein